jgi:hypothetical protein
MSIEKKEEVTTVNDELTQEIEGAVTNVVEQAEAERKERQQSAAPAADGQQAATTDDDGDGGDTANADTKDGDKDGDKAVTDDLIERAVKAGLSLKDAQSITDPELLTRVVERIESTKKAADEKLPAGEKKEDAQDDDASDPLDGIPDLDPEEYDEKIVAGFKAMKDIIKLQRQELSAMKTRSGGDGDAITKQLQKLGQDYADAAPAGSGERAELEKKLRVLKAGYKAAGEEIAENDLFAEAAKMVLGDVVDERKTARKADQVAARKKLHLGRPSGTSTKPKGDVFEDVAKEIDAVFGKM